MSRQNYYRQRRSRSRAAVDEGLVVALVRAQRRMQPFLGARKLLFLVGPELRRAGVAMGRDRFFATLSRHGLLIPRVRRGARTTESRHGFAVYGNLAKGLRVTGPDQLWVSDITYIRTREGFMYLCLIMDSFSRKIVGYDCSDSLEMEGALRALGLAVKQLPRGAHPVHHSDRGSQYCCGTYVELLTVRGLGISMTEDKHCYENGKAERLNGTLKREYGLGDNFLLKQDVRPAVLEAVALYNGSRPHQALGNECPSDVHRKKIPAPRTRAGRGKNSGIK